MQTVVTVSAVFLRINFTKVVEQSLSSALVALCVCYCLCKKLFTNLLLGDRFTLHKLLQFENIVETVEGNALSLSAVSSCSSGLLIVTLQRLWYVVVNYKSNIRLIYSHTECNGCNNYIYLLHKELVLVLRSGCSIKSGMVRSSLYSIDIQQLSHLLHLLSGEAVDNTALARIVAYELNNLLLRIYFWTNLIVEVRSVK